MSQKVSDADFIAVWHKTGGSPRKAAALLDMSERAVYGRRERLERKGIALPTLSIALTDGRATYIDPTEGRSYCKRRPFEIENGAVVVFSDAHWWPGRDVTLAHRALLKIVRDIKPVAVIANGDVLDAPRISRHEPNGWEEAPPLFAEVETVAAHLAEIREAARGAATFRTIGNHDIRFDRMLATRVPDVKHLAGMMLRDHLPDWPESWSVEINAAVMVKHRWHKGIHGPYNNVLKGGRSIVTGHLHRLLATPYADYNGRRYGVDCGTLAEIGGPQFDYSEDAPANWGSGFAVLTFHRGRMLPPEFCEVLHGEAFFRGSIVDANAAVIPRRGSEVRRARSGGGRGGGVPADLGDAARGADADAPARFAGGPTRPARNRGERDLRV